MSDRVTIPGLQAKAARGERITMLTAYDYGLGRLLDQAQVDVVLVGDSLGMVALGYASTVPVTMEEMLHHAKAVRRGVRRSLLVGDMPFMSFQQSPAEAVRNAGRFVKEAGCEAVKVEGGLEAVAAAKAIVDVGIPVMGHVGLTPQTAARFGGFTVRGRRPAEAAALLRAAERLQRVGCFALVLECVPARLAQRITARLRIPTLGIGAGPWCDGQVLVTDDLLGLFDRFQPRFVKRYAQLGQAALAAVQTFRREVEQGQFPTAAHSYSAASASGGLTTARRPAARPRGRRARRA